ncbi:RagB/SusD family nutrient uptake outer membrane protein [Pedobacter sp. SYSU D00535]|uniref:RagB/SusD family nutrient uptake outer membrane protein n=1 Tax=Pedobacter sp. SYSU D00535 TaxID=2810308 RepID=UPI001A977413|nr:RagB/SusD family nutrient uptake outer membrane protein [Pedobacter sp. SYSU D00535]
MNKIKLLLISLTIICFGCKDMFEPEVENIRQIEESYKEPRFAQGILISAYARIPTDSWDFSDMATDNAVASNETNNFYRMSTGEWAANFNPLETWANCFAAINYTNLALEIADTVTYSRTEGINKMFQDRAKGEAHGLRALFLFHLLRAHSGMSGGRLLGVPLFTEYQLASKGSIFNRPRATFEECMKQLNDDIAKATGLLPDDYRDVASVPAKYQGLGVNSGDYNRVFGDGSKLLLSGRVAKAIRAQAALLAASPAYEGSGTTWAQAAEYAAEIIDLNGGVAGLSNTAQGVTWYLNTNGQLDNIGNGNNPPEILWRNSVPGNSLDLEENHFPPTLFGRGLLNPTQNLVDAFPMSNGYPIGHPQANYNPSQPYANRDPRLAHFIVYNGSTAGVNSSTIITAADGNTDDAINRVETSTRTGYYMRKLLRQDVNLSQNSRNGQRHIKPRFRYTEFYLAYAEAANEAFGPLGTGSRPYSAYDVIKAIRQRAGIGGGDPYLESIKGDKNAMRQLIRNERRLELSFEGFRFWDLRRWKENLTEPAKGMLIQGGTYNVVNVDNRVYQNHMVYGPVPYLEVLKFSELQQNDNW